MAADLTVEPRIYVNTEYNDNVEETKNGKGDTVATVKPGVSIKYDHSRVNLDLSYDFEFKKYLGQVKDDEENHYLKSSLDVEALKDLFFIEVKDNYSKVYENAARGDLPDGDTSTGTTDRNDFSFKPYFQIPVQDRTKLKVGGEFKDIWYSEEGNIDKRIYSLFADMDHELTDVWSLTVGAGYDQHEMRFEDGGFRRYSTTFGTKYTYAEGSYIKAELSPTYTDFNDDSATDKTYYPYLLGITHAFTENLIGTASSEMKFTEDPKSSDTLNTFIQRVGIENKYERGTIEFSLAYNEYEQTDSTVKTAYWRPKIGGTHNLTERLDLNYSAYTDLHTSPDDEKYIFALAGLRYSLSESASLGISYRFKHSDKPGSDDDYVSNTIGANFSWRY